MDVFPEENFIAEIANGKDLNRVAYQAIKSPLGLREGDILIIPSLDIISKKQNMVESVRFTDFDDRSTFWARMDS